MQQELHADDPSPRPALPPLHPRARQHFRQWLQRQEEMAEAAGMSPKRWFRLVSGHFADPTDVSYARLREPPPSDSSRKLWGHVMGSAPVGSRVADYRTESLQGRAFLMRLKGTCNNWDGLLALAREMRDCEDLPLEDRRLILGLISHGSAAALLLVFAVGLQG